MPAFLLPIVAVFQSGFGAVIGGTVILLVFLHLVSLACWCGVWTWRLVRKVFP